MENEIRQVLMNQSTILRLLIEGRKFKNEELFSVSNRLKETELLLNPKQEESLPIKTENA